MWFYLKHCDHLNNHTYPVFKKTIWLEIKYLFAAVSNTIKYTYNNDNLEHIVMEWNNINVGVSNIKLGKNKLNVKLTYLASRKLGYSFPDETVVKKNIICIRICIQVGKFVLVFIFTTIYHFQLPHIIGG